MKAKILSGQTLAAAAIALALAGAASTPAMAYHKGHSGVHKHHCGMKSHCGMKRHGSCHMRHGCNMKHHHK